MILVEHLSEAILRTARTRFFMSVSGPDWTIENGSLVVESVNRKLIRPSLNEMKDQMHRRNNNQKKAAPPDQTNAENFYYMKQMQAKTPMVFVLKDGETLHGVIEWYDKTCLKINRDGEPNLLIFKPNIKYMYKA